MHVRTAELERKLNEGTILDRLKMDHSQRHGKQDDEDQRQHCSHSRQGMSEETKKQPSQTEDFLGAMISDRTSQARIPAIPDSFRINIDWF
jgi:hypothetical protein